MSLRLFILVCLVLGSGCKTPAVTLQPGPRVFTPDSYPIVWSDWTREAESFSWQDLAHELVAQALQDKGVVIVAVQASQTDQTSLAQWTKKVVFASVNRPWLRTYLSRSSPSTNSMAM